MATKDPNKSPFVTNALTQARAKQSNSKVAKKVSVSRTKDSPEAGLAILGGNALSAIPGVGPLASALAAPFLAAGAGKQAAKRKASEAKTAKTKGPSTIPQRDLAPEPKGPEYSTFEELLNSILAQYSGGGGGVDRSPYDAAGAKIAAMYRQLEGSYGADAEKLKAIFDQAASDYAANAASAQANIGSAYSGSQAERMRQLQALGIEESAAVVGDAATRDRANALSNVARMLEATQGRNTGYREAASTLNQQMQGVARLQAAAQQAAIEQAYAKAAANAASSGGIDMGDAISIARQQMAEQDKQLKALTPQQGYGYSDVDALYKLAESRGITDPTEVNNFIRNYQKTW